VWERCLDLAGVIRRAHGNSPEALTERQRRFRVWDLSPDTGERLTVTLLALSFHALAVDTAAATGQPVSATGLEETAFATVVESATRRRQQELLAALPEPPYSGSQDVDVLKLLMYDGSGKAAITVERLAQEARSTLEELISRFADPDLSFRACFQTPFGDAQRAFRSFDLGGLPFSEGSR
jgi:hypothetical protein